MSELKQLLMDHARAKGICIDGYNVLHRASDRAAMIDYYLANPDWCMERDFPSLEILSREFSDCEDKGIFIGRTFDGQLLDRKQAYIFHNCRGTIRVAMDYDNAIIPMLYFANSCRMIIKCDQKENKNHPIEVPLYSFGKNDIQAHDNPYVRYLRFKTDLI